MIKRIFFLAVINLFIIHAYAADSLQLKENTRDYTVRQFFRTSLAEKALVSQIFAGIGFRKSRLAYTIVKIEARTEIFTSTYPLGFFKRLRVYFITFFNNLKKSPQSAMALLFPLFLLALMGIASPVFYKSLIVRPVLEEPKKPDNDTSKEED